MSYSTSHKGVLSSSFSLFSISSQQWISIDRSPCSSSFFLFLLFLLITGGNDYWWYSTSNWRETLSLYRDILRATQFFMWSNARGVIWRDILRENARKEFEEARHEKDPEIITQLQIGGRDAVESALEKLVEKQRQQIAREHGGGD